MTSRLPLQALTLHRPFPWAMTHGGKSIENRGWPPPDVLFGRRFALHAGKTWDQDGADFVKRLAPSMPGSSADHPLGIVAVVRLVGIIDAETSDVRWWDAAPHAARSLDTRWLFGPFGWIVDDVTPIDPPVPCRGMQGLWKVPDAELAIVRERWKAARHV